MTIRLAFINPVGTGIYDAQMQRTLVPFARPDTVVDVLHFEGVPEDIAYYLPKHIIELGLLELAPVLEAAGYDAIIVGCCFDPGVRVARDRRACWRRYPWGSGLCPPRVLIVCLVLTT